MKGGVLGLLALGCLLGVGFYLVSTENQQLRTYNTWKYSQEFSLFTKWVSEFDKTYAHEAELMMRFGVWYNTHQMIEHVNSQKLNYTFGHNQFSDLTKKEFEDIYLMDISELPEDETEELAAEPRDPTNPKEKLWRNEGAVAEVQSQGGCGSCWDFAGVGAVEGQVAIKTGKLYKLSEQLVMDCSNKDCAGGYPAKVYETFQTIAPRLASDYPYAHKAHKDADGNKICDLSKPGIESAMTNGMGKVPMDEVSLENHLAKNVIAVQVHFADIAHYKEGVYDGPCPNSPQRHAVLLTGYGELNGTQYWEIKNSWGSGWGDQGFGRFKKGVDQALGLCGVAHHATHPIIV